MGKFSFLNPSTGKWLKCGNLWKIKDWVLSSSNMQN